MKNANNMYERLKGKGKIVQRALNILNESGKLNKNGRPYSLPYVYKKAKERGDDPQVDMAILEACEAYLSEVEQSKSAVKEKEREVLARMEAVLA